MRSRHLLVGVLAVLLFAAPLVPMTARAAGDGSDPESRVGVFLAVMCGASLRAAFAVPVPWAGVAVMSCLGMLIDAATSPDANPASGSGTP